MATSGKGGGKGSSRSSSRKPNYSRSALGTPF